ncbi:MAG: T9SS type A sorting domain-containing protein [Sphingobacteriales bacterium]|nr:MAG: T9SS type A sorting domain-containing protein [Sphingobacteriales bacterium]
MKKLLPIVAIFSCCSAYAQNPIDNYTTSTNTYTEIGTGLGSPVDLDFVPGRPGELWVLNRESTGGSFHIFFNAGKSNQVMQFRRDSHNDHFMARCVAFCFGDKDYFGTAQDVLNTSPGSTFMGPALWNSDTSIFASMHQSDWDPSMPLGSHIDMLHQSPHGMGIAHDNANVYWYFDGYNSNIVKFDFATPHGVGEDDHSDGRVHRYTDISVKKVLNQPSHMVLDKQNKWLYLVDGGNKKVMRLNTATGNVGQDLPPIDEPLAEYKEVTGATYETVVSGMNKPVGIDYRKDRLLVSDVTTGDIMIYNTTSMPAQLVGTIHTGGPGVMGVRIDNDNKIWYVNNTTKKVYRIDNPKVAAVHDMPPAKTVSFSIYPNPASTVLNISIADVNVSSKADIAIFDMTGRRMFTATADQPITSVNTQAWAKGIYNVVLTTNGSSVSSQVVIK